MNLTDGETFATDLIKCTKTRFNQKIRFLRDTKRRMREIAINNDWNTHIVQILHEIRDTNFLFKGKFLNRLSKPAELTQ